MSRWYEDFCSNSSLGYSFGNNTWQGYSEFPCLNLFNPFIRQYFYFEIVQAGIHWFAALCVCVQLRQRPERYRKDYGGVIK